MDEARELLAAFATLRATTALPALVRSLGDVRLRPHLVDTLAEISDPRAKEPILRALTEERYVHLRAPEARAVLKLGGKNELFAPLSRFAGTPEPMVEAIAIAREAKLLTPDRGGKEWGTPTSPATATVRFAKAGVARLLVLADPTTPANAALLGEINGAPVAEMAPYADNLYVVEVGELRAGTVQVRLSRPTVRAIWLVEHAAEIPPPPPREWATKAEANVVDGGL